MEQDPMLSYNRLCEEMRGILQQHANLYKRFEEFAAYAAGPSDSRN